MTYDTYINHQDRSTAIQQYPICTCVIANMREYDTVVNVIPLMDVKLRMSNYVESHWIHLNKFPKSDYLFISLVLLRHLQVCAT